MKIEHGKRLLRAKEVLNKTGLTRSNMYLWISEGKFPKQISLGARTAAWLESEIDEWIDEKIKISRKHKK